MIYCISTISKGEHSARC